MQNESIPSTTDPIGLETHPEFNVVLAYDEYAGGVRAKEFFDALVRDHSELFQFICHLWKFEVLREPHLFDVAARDVAKADMIVLAIRPSQELSVEVRRWVEHWLSFKQDDPGALVALLGGRPGHAGSATTVGATLRQLAETANVQVFCNEIDWPAKGLHFIVPITKRQLREEPRRHAPPPCPYAGQPRWGLNE